MYTPNKPPKISFRLEESEVMEFKLLKLKKVMERMKDELKKEFDFLKYVLHSIWEEILNDIRDYHTLNSCIIEEVKEIKDVEFESHIGKVEEQYLKKKRFESTYDLSSLRDPYFHGFNSTPRNYFIPKTNMSMFDGNYPLTWIFHMEQCFETMMKQLSNQAIMEYLIKWKNLPI